MQQRTVVPFDAFLDLLRSKGYAIGLHEYTALAVLLGRWDRTHVSELGDALAALIGRGDDEVYGIRRLFNEVYAPAPPPVVPLPVEVEGNPLPFWRRHAWALALIAAAVLLAVGLSFYRPPPAPPVAEPPVVPPIPGRAPENTVAIPPPPPPPLPDPPTRIERPLAAAALAGSFLAALALFWSMKVREGKRAWLSEAWSTVLASLPGPYHYDEIVRDRRPLRLPRSDVEDAATLLGRVFSRVGQARELDVPRSIRATLRQGLLPVLLTKPRRIAETVFVLQDVCQEMRLWEPKVEAFLTDVRRQGISLQRLYFDGDVSRLSDRPHRLASPIENVLRARPDAPIMIISSGSGLAAVLTDPDEPWLRLLGNRGRTTWLTPVSDVRLWPRAFEWLPIDVWPMTRLGLLGAARQLAGIDAEAGPEVRARIVEEGRVTLEDIERLKRLASLVPHPTPALLNLLRHRFAPDISDAALMHLMVQAEGPSAPIVRLDDDEVRRSVNLVRRENPDLEVAVRETVLGVLLDSEPVSGSAAHERWRINVEVQRLLLADAAGPQVDTSRSLEALRAIARGPMWQEVQEALRIAPETPAVAAYTRQIAAGGDVGEVTPPSDDERLALAGRMPWSWPGARELVPAALAALLVFGGALAIGALPVRGISHLPDAYELTYAPVPSVAMPQLALTRRSGDDAVPRVVDLYRGTEIFRSGVTLTEGAPTAIQLAPEETGSYYQARAVLPESNLAVSNAVWVTSDQLSFIAINAAPWAEVTITDGQTTTEPQQTPFTAALMPGSYQFTFRNPALNPPSTIERTFTVPGSGSALYVPMPGFDAASAVDALIGATAQ